MGYPPQDSTQQGIARMCNTSNTTHRTQRGSLSLSHLLVTFLSGNPPFGSWRYRALTTHKQRIYTIDKEAVAALMMHHLYPCGGNNLIPLTALNRFLKKNRTPRGRPPSYLSRDNTRSAAKGKRKQATGNRQQATGNFAQCDCARTAANCNITSCRQRSRLELVYERTHRGLDKRQWQNLNLQ